MGLRENIKANEALKKIVLRFLMSSVKCRPQWWIRIFFRIYAHCGAKSVIYRSVRKDIVPFRKFVLGKRSVIEDYSTINNAVGDILIGDDTRIGIHSTVIGPVHIGNHVMIAQGVTVSGLNHTYTDVEMTIDKQKVTTDQIFIEDDVWIGANSVITSGVSIGRHVVIGSGSIVTSDIPDYSVAIGTPAKVVKKYDFEKHLWQRM